MPVNACQCLSIILQLSCYYPEKLWKSCGKAVEKL
jgi:hypothetical protein